MQVMERDRINVALQAEALRLLASLFRRPDGSLTVSIDALLSVYADEPAAVTSLETMRNSLEAGDLTPLLVDYTQLFIGSFEMTAPPYASYYLSPSPAVGGAVTQEIASFYAKRNLTLDAQEKMPADFIGFMFEFVYRQVFAYLQTEDEGHLNAVDLFCEKYLLGWVPTFFLRMRDSARTDYYRELSHIGLNYLPIGFGVR